MQLQATVTGAFTQHMAFHKTKCPCAGQAHTVGPHHCSLGNIALYRMEALLHRPASGSRALHPMPQAPALAHRL
ncbi:unnamed protein product [Sphagnum troendelagicum]|jgi:hypothetical protein